MEDFITPVMGITIPAGSNIDGYMGSTNITIQNDDIYERDQTFSIQLIPANPSVRTFRNSAIVIVIDDEGNDYTYRVAM